MYYIDMVERGSHKRSVNGPWFSNRNWIHRDNFTLTGCLVDPENPENPENPEIGRSDLRNPENPENSSFF